MSKETVSTIPINVNQNIQGIQNPDGTVTYRIRARVADIPTDYNNKIPMRPNARYPRLSARTCKNMMRKLIVKPEEFLNKNSGIVISADRVSVKDGHVNLYFPNSDIYGSIDGGHTLATIMKFNQDMKNKLSEEDKNKSQVELEIITGIDTKNKISSIVQSRNDKLGVKRIDIFNQSPKSNDLKSLLAQTSFAHNIRFKTNTPMTTVKFTNVLEILDRFCKDSVEFSPVTGMAVSLSDMTAKKRVGTNIKAYASRICGLDKEFYSNNWDFYETLFTLVEMFDKDCCYNIDSYILGKRRRNALIDSCHYETENDIKAAKITCLPEKMAIACTTMFMPFIKAHGTKSEEGFVGTVKEFEWTTDIVGYYQSHKKKFFDVLKASVFNREIMSLITNGTMPNTIKQQKLFNQTAEMFNGYLYKESKNSQFSE